MFEHSVTIFRVWGIPVKLHITLLLFLPYAAFVTSRQFRSIAIAAGFAPESLGAPPLVWGLILAVGLFVGIFLHELAHTAVARRSGGSVQSITLMMLGGVSELEREVRPDREAWMALAGPLASFGIAIVSYLVFRFLPLPPGVSVAIFVFAITNLVLGVFNLLPAFPMDGGRVLRGLLVKPLGPARATRVATTVGKWMAIAFGILGLLSFNVLLVLIAVFIYMGASAERSRAATRDVLAGIRVRSVMNDRMGEARLGESSGAVAIRLLRDHLAGAKVVSNAPDGGATMGIVTSQELVARASQGAADAPVQTAMHTDFPTVHPDDDAADALDLLTRGAASAVVVLDGRDEIIGLVTPMDIERAMAVASLSRGGHRPWTPSEPG